MEKETGVGVIEPHSRLAKLLGHILSIVQTERLSFEICAKEHLSRVSKRGKMYTLSDIQEAGSSIIIHMSPKTTSNLRLSFRFSDMIGNLN